jgi:dTDP-glucose 4,6-dehydratase
VIFDKLTYAGHLASIQTVLKPGKVVFVKGDIANEKDVLKLYQNFKPTYVFNFAAESHVDRSIEGPGEFVRTNVLGTFQMLEGACRFFAGLSPIAKKEFRFLHISTDEVYGTLGSKGFFTERTSYAPNSPYSASKAGADHLVRAYHETYGLPVLLTNCSNNYGPFQFPEKLIPLMVLNALEGKALPVYGDGGNIRDWLYVEDHCEALWTVMRRGKIGDKYNVGGDSERTNKQVVHTICSMMDRFLPASKNPQLAGGKIKVYTDLITFVKDRPGHDRRYAIDASKIKKELGWKPKHSFNSGIQMTVQWYLDNQEWCEQVQAGRYSRQRLGLVKKY